MKFVISLCLFFLFQSGFCQTSSKSLKKEQQQLENKISNTKKLLKQVKSSQQNSLNSLRLIDNQIKSREELVRVFDNQGPAAAVGRVRSARSDDAGCSRRGGSECGLGLGWRRCRCAEQAAGRGLQVADGRHLLPCGVAGG